MFLVLDYDETYTKDPEFWDSVITKAKERNHTVVCCTYRFEVGMDNWDVERDMGKNGVPIVYAASYKSKFEAMLANGWERAANAVWIDDMPNIIFS